MKNFRLILIAILALFVSCKSTNKTSAVQEKLKLDAETRLKELIDRQEVILADTDDGVNLSITYNNSTNQNTTNITLPSSDTDSNQANTDSSKKDATSSNGNQSSTSNNADGSTNQEDVNKTTTSSNNGESNVKYTKDDVLNDELFKESESYRDMSERALNAQSYQVALDKANDGHTVLDKYLANRAIRRVTTTYNEAEEAGLTTSNPDEMTSAVTLIDDASIGVDRKEYVLALNNAEQAQSLLDALLRDKKKGSADKYTVVSGDCLWRIAKKPQIYNNSHAWPKIYMANKKKFKQPDNPHLIFPDQVFDIPRK